jgi:hypothetical protein
VFVPRWAERVQHLTYQYMWVTMVLLLVWSRLIAPLVRQISHGLYNWIHALFSTLFLLL